MPNTEAAETRHSQLYIWAQTGVSLVEMVHHFPLPMHFREDNNLQHLTEVWNPFTLQEVKLKPVIYTNHRESRAGWILIKMNGCVGRMSWAILHHLFCWTQKAVQYVLSIETKRSRNMFQILFHEGQ